MSEKHLFPNLFSPLSIGKVTLKNRIMSTGHDTVLPTDGTVNDALLAYHRARAEGGAGLIVSQVTGVHRSARYTSHILMAVDDDCIPGFRRLAETLHAHDCKLFVQLFHPGREIMETEDGTAPVAYAPSASPSERFHVMPRALSAEMIAEIIEGYGTAAGRMRQAGVDGVEFIASHGYLLAQFLNPQVNRRSDAYGGSSENRLRFLREAIGAARRATGPDFVIGMRISGDEKDPEGLTEDIALEAIKALEDSLDYVNVIAGSSVSLGAAIHIVPPMFVENAYIAPFAAAVKKAVSIPVMVAGRINQPHEAEAVISSGQADICGMTRAMICDPQMPAKAEVGRPDDIRACIGCNQACIGHFHKGVPISCIQHPETGRELVYGKRLPSAAPKKVLVAGGGPAGMKAAAVAAQRGHKVSLYESQAQLGGQALLAQLLPGRAEFGGIATNLAKEMELAGVSVTLSCEVDRTLIDRERPDAVIVATGGKPRWPEALQIEEGAHVVDAWQVLRNEANLGGSVVIADWRCDWVGLGLAELLAASGRRVRLAVNGLHAGELLQSYVRDTMASRIHRLGVEVTPYARLYGVDEDTAYFQHSASGDPIIFEEVESLVLAQGQEPQDALLGCLEGYEGEILPIGDCLAARTAEEAVLEGLKAAWSL
jgi:2,4-dienoyl-CoA reductase-like NADH-dependent reductase (Old Yellow Enzyme family)